ncbi:lipoprotein [Caballeronia hypogeia]|uniref:Lipoprotein n=2 Tax=Caballeronia hypogeia TaxID=1777140 RepID=A0A158BHR2_9BURK|nr:lipoprotein [Caballeronia hypogeia]
MLFSEAEFVIVEMRGYQLLQLFLSCLLKMASMNPAKRELEKLMKRAALVLLMIGSLSVAGEASAHGYGGHGGGHGGGGDGGAIVGALIGGAVLGALVTSVANAQPAYAQPVYEQPAYAQPAYAQPVYAQPAQPPGYCYDNYRNAYVPCGY